MDQHTERSEKPDHADNRAARFRRRFLADKCRPGNDDTCLTRSRQDRYRVDEGRREWVAHGSEHCVPERRDRHRHGECRNPIEAIHDKADDRREQHHRELRNAEQSASRGLCVGDGDTRVGTDRDDPQRKEKHEYGKVAARDTKYATQVKPNRGFLRISPIPVRSNSANGRRSRCTVARPPFSPRRANKAVSKAAPATIQYEYVPASIGVAPRPEKISGNCANTNAAIITTPNPVTTPLAPISFPREEFCG